MSSNVVRLCRAKTLRGNVKAKRGRRGRRELVDATQSGLRNSGEMSPNNFKHQKIPQP